MVLIAFPNVFIVQIQIRLLRYGYAGMPQQLTQRVNIHAVHQASFGEVIPQTMGCEAFVKTGTDNVFLEVTFKIADHDMAASFPHREHIFAFYITILEL